MKLLGEAVILSLWRRQHTDERARSTLTSSKSTTAMTAVHIPVMTVTTIKWKIIRFVLRDEINVHHYAAF